LLENGEEVSAVHIATTATEIEGAISAVAALIGAVVAVRSQRRTSDSNDKSTEDVESQAEYRVIVGADSTAQKERLEQAKLNEAEILIKGGHYRAAIAILQFTLDHSLQEAIGHSSIKPAHPLRSSIQKAKALSRENMLDESGVAATKLFSKVYNHAVCDFREPTADDAHLAVELIRYIMQSIPV
jgi:hypothetical protein